MQLQQNPELALQIKQQELMNQQAAAQGQLPMPNVHVRKFKSSSRINFDSRTNAKTRWYLKLVRVMRLLN